MTECVVHLPRPHDEQARLVDSAAKRTVVRGGRRGGKTVGAAILAVKRFLAGRRVLYAAPTQEQVSAFWYEVTAALSEPIDAGVFHKNEVDRTISLKGTKQQIKAKTAWNADTLRGDYADLLIFDEWQLSNEDAWAVVGAPMLLDNNGDAIFIYTPPSLHSRFMSKAQDPRHASKLYKKAAEQQAAGNARWSAIHFTSYANPHISAEALSFLTEDMTALAMRQEIDAEDVEKAPGALWDASDIEEYRVDVAPDLVRLLVAIDPPAESTAVGSGAGIMVGGMDDRGHGYLLEDGSLDNVAPAAWGNRAVELYEQHSADLIVGEVNNGGEMVEHVVRSILPDVNYGAVHASRGKALRAEPISAKSARGLIHHVGDFPKLEDELCMWAPGAKSPHRLDAYVWLFTKLLFTPRQAVAVYENRVAISRY